MRQTSALHFLDKPLEQMSRINLPLPNKEALRLYRDVIKFTKYFDWKDPRGDPWSLVLKKSARMELENSREEPDPVKLGQMLIAGREALQMIKEKYNKKQYDFVKQVDATRNDKGAAFSAGVNKNKIII